MSDIFSNKTVIGLIATIQAAIIPSIDTITEIGQVASIFIGISLGLLGLWAKYLEIKDRYREK